MKLIHGRKMKNETHVLGFTATSCMCFFIFFLRENKRKTTGKPNQVTKKEHNNVMIIVLVNTLKYAPATPLMSMKGIKITMVLIDEPTIAGNKNLIAFCTMVG